MVERLRSVRTVGMAMTLLSGLILISNVAGLVISLLLSEDVKSNVSASQEGDYSLLVAVLDIGLSLALLVAGVFLAKFKNWARVLALVVAGLYSLYIWGQAIFLAPSNSLGKGDQTYERFIMAFMWSIPFLLLIKFLTGKQVKNSVA